MEQYSEQKLPLWYRIIPPCFLLFLTGLIYYPSLHYEFQFDDIANIKKHFEIRHYVFSKLFFSGTRWISYWLNSLHYKIGKFDPFSYRLGNVIIHSLNGILVFLILLLILQRLTQKSFFTRNAFALSFITALLFLLHPVQTQTVSYVIQGQLEGIAAFFSLSMVLCFLLFNYSSSLWVRILNIVLFFILGIFSTGTKEIAIVTPALIILVDWFFVARGSWQSLKSRFVLHALCTIIIISLYIYLLHPKFFIDLFSLNMTAGNNLGNIITKNYDDAITPYYFFISQFKVILHYLWIFIWPFNISVEYDWVLAKSFFAPDCIFPFLALAIMGFILYKFLLQNRTNFIGFAALWFVICIMPRSSIIPSPELLVDYKTYLASFGWLFIIASTMIKLYELLRWNNHTFKTFAEKTRFAYIAPLIIATLLGTITVHRNTVWRSTLEFWANIVENAPGKARAYNNYGVELSQKLGKFAESIPYFEHAINMDKFYRDPYNNLAVAYAATHQLDRAIETLRISIRNNPLYAEAYNNLASFLMEKKDYEQAKHALVYAIRLRSYYGKAYFNLGRLYMEQNEPEKACEAFRKACMEADLDNEVGFSTYAHCCLHLKKYDEAIFAFKKLLEYNPNNHEALFNLANAYHAQKDFNNAIHFYTQLLRKNVTDEKTRYNLAEAYFNAGNMREALYHFEKLQHNPMIPPNLFIRIASCYEKLGNPERAKITLEQLLRKNVSPAMRESIKGGIEQLRQQYHIT
jgi:tetratricopeptide (TPR) repeat protein